jgi:protein SCO1/2
MGILSGFWRGARQTQRWLTAVLIVAAIVVFAAACGSSKASTSAPEGAPASGSVSLHGAFPTAPVPKPNLTLTDTSGQPFNLVQQTQGKVTLVYFGYTHCPDVCPATMAELGTIMKQLPKDIAQQIAVVFITTDPARDTPQVLREWLDHFSPSFIGLTGTEAQIAQAQQAVGLPPAQKEADGNGGYGVNHAAFVLAYTRDNLAHVVYPEGVTINDYKADLIQLVRKDAGALPPSAPRAGATSSR